MDIRSFFAKKPAKKKKSSANATAAGTRSVATVASGDPGESKSPPEDEQKNQLPVGGVGQDADDLKPKSVKDADDLKPKSIQEADDLKPKKMQHSFSCESALYNTPSGQIYGHPVQRFGGFEPGDIDCQVVPQYSKLKTAQTKQCKNLLGYNERRDPPVWRCKSCLHYRNSSIPMKERFMSLQDRYANGGWFSMSDFMAYKEFPVEKIHYYLYYYRLSHIIIMRDLIHSNDDEDDGLPKGLAEKIGFHCGIHSMQALKQIVIDNDKKWEEAKRILKGSDNLPSLNDEQIVELEKTVKSLDQETIDEWFELADNGNAVFMRQCKSCSIKRSGSAGNTAKETYDGEIARLNKIKRRHRIKLLSLNNESVCKHQTCGAIIDKTVTNLETYQIMGGWCKRCYITNRKTNMNIRTAMYKEKLTREKECWSNIHKNKEHKNSRKETDSTCFLADHPCDACTKHHQSFHKKIIAPVNVAHKRFCRCAANCFLYPNRRMESLEQKIFNILKQDKLAGVVDTFVQKEKLIFEEGHGELNAEQDAALKKKILVKLSKTVVSKNKEWDHFNRKQKIKDISDISNKAKRNKEQEVCVLMDKPCHRFKSILERRNNNNNNNDDDDDDDDDDAQVRRIIKTTEQERYYYDWKLEQFENNGKCCTLLQDMYGVSCPFGHGTHQECKKHIKRVEEFLADNERYDNPLDFYLKGCFDIHHKDPNAKKGSWTQMIFEEMKILLKTDGRLTCVGCHDFVTCLLRQDNRNKSLIN